MTMTLSEKFYGLSEGVFRACQFLGLKFPTTIPKELADSYEHMPSDYFGDSFELDEEAKKKLCDERGWKTDDLAKRYNSFARNFLKQKCFSKHCQTDLTVYFCDYVFSSGKEFGPFLDEYFAFEFYNKSFAIRDNFRTERQSRLTQRICNDFFARELLRNKSKANVLFSEFLHRDWVYTGDCTFEEFKAFVEKHPRFISKLIAGAQGKGAEIINVNPNDNIEELFISLKNNSRLLEEIIIQHEEVASFCPDTVNTIRVCTLLDTHNAIHILNTSGRFGRKNGVVDNFHGGGMAVAINPKTGVIISDALNGIHDRMPKHPDTGKIFKGFQYPCWEKVLAAVKKMARMIPQLRHIGWDIAVNDKGEAVLVEANGDGPSVDLQQAPHDTGILHLYQPLLDELQNYKREHMKLLGWRVNNLRNFDSRYELDPKVWKQRLRLAMTKLIPPPTCYTLLDLGCRKEKFAKSFCPENMIYCPVDFKKHDDEVIACDFNNGEFPDVTADAILCALTAEFVEHLPQFLSDMCNAAQKQILMWCRPVDKEIYDNWRWNNPFLVDFTEEFLLKIMAQNNFELHAQYPDANPSVILYDFRKTSLK